MNRRVGAVLVGAVAMLGVLGIIAPGRTRAQAQRTPVAVPLVAVKGVGVRSVHVSRVLTLAGTVHAMRTAELSTRLSGLVTHIPVEEGDRVVAGQPLVYIDVSSVNAQAAQASADVDLAAAAVRESQEATNQAVAGLASVTAHRSLLNAQLAQAEASLHQARLDRKRTAYMFSRDAVSKADLDRADTNVKLAQARVAGVRASYTAWRAERTQARAAVAQSRASVARTQAAVDVARQGVGVVTSELPYGTLRAPFNGAVVRKFVHVGDLATPGRPLLEVDDISHLHLDVNTPQRLVRDVTIGSRLPVEVDGIRGPVSGRVYQIVPSGDPKTRTFLVKVALEYRPGLLSGMYGRIRLACGEHSVLEVPRTAVYRRGQLLSVFVVDTQNPPSGASGVVRMRIVKVGEIRGSQVEVRAGLNANVIVVDNPTDLLADGTPVRVESEGSH